MIRNGLTSSQTRLIAKGLQKKLMKELETKSVRTNMKTDENVPFADVVDVQRIYGYYGW